jgi:hypothetical protein
MILIGELGRLPMSSIQIMRDEGLIFSFGQELDF